MEIGIVITHVITIRPTVVQLMERKRMALPVPIIADVMTWVVDSGIPK